ncbi:MAG: hypothetical protein AMS26_05275 [Bacteroides sp. SM23_62]|nr:MAG: hypothetical protein AMS26_05275 [Bacteroides sp. SM23_62]
MTGADKAKLPGWFIGTSGWSYRHWSGIFYPEDVKPDRYLEFYITKFNCVELNSSFYHLPRESAVKGWMNRTPESFRFCPKLSRFITHQKRLADCEDALRKYFDLFQDMKIKLGPVLIQLPPGLSYDGSLIRDFFDVLKGQHNQYRFAIEVRHASWISDDFFLLLEQYGVAFVIADSGNRFPYHEAVTADHVYLRLHGPEKLYASDYDRSELVQYAEKIMHWISTGHEIWVFFNNDFGGYAVKNAMRLREMVDTDLTI